MDLQSANSVSVFDMLRQRMMLPDSWTIEQSRPVSRSEQMTEAIKQHWPEYLMEATELALFMLLACAFTVLLYHPASPLFRSFPNEILRRAAMGVAMGSTAIAIIFSPLGKRSGAHFNPAVTLTFLRLGKVRPWDASFYIVAQFIGGITGVVVAMWLLGPAVADPTVNYATTQPGPQGPLVAFFAELLISFVLMSVVLRASNSKKFARWTGIFAGVLVASYITFESPISGMSMNPARTFGSAFGAGVWMSLWIYFVAPPLGMLLAAEVFTKGKGRRAVACAKFHHHNKQRCIFRCNFEG